ncbi:MAG: metallophosphoesterase [Bryobacteraceae bacterium]
MRLLFLLFSAWTLCAQGFHVYVGALSADSVTLAWGTTKGGRENTIGRNAISPGEATIQIANRKVTTNASWIAIGELKSDTVYPYSVSIGGRVIGEGRVRTWPAKTNKATFFVMGDYGSGRAVQYRIATLMADTMERLEKAGTPVRFILTTGDNLYADFPLGPNTGGDDADWERKFFTPYERVLRSVPFYPSLGNHDGNESEHRRDLETYLDNFFFPGPKAERYYAFDFGGLIDFFAVDSTRNTTEGRPRPNCLPGSPQETWLKSTLAASKAPWKIPFYHHPIFGAGPHFAPRSKELVHLVNIFRDAGVKVVFNGHEHNFQFTEANEATGGIRFVVTGAGGELSKYNVRRNMAVTHTEGWAAQYHFLQVDVDGKTMRITPLSFDEMTVTRRDGSTIKMPIEVTTP